MKNFFANADGSSHSLKQRLLIGTIISLPIFFSLTGLALDSAFQRSLITAEKNNLQGKIYLLLAAAEIERDNKKLPPKLWMPEVLLEPRFNQLKSGLYGTVFDAQSQKILWQSSSAQISNAKLASQQQLARTADFKVGSSFQHDDTFFLAYQDVFWDSPSGAIPLRFAISHDKHNFLSELLAYRDQLWLWLCIAAAGLIGFQASMMHWGLRPLRKLASALKAMQSGDSVQVVGEFPRETRPLVDNLNLLLQRDASQRQRYREGLGNLAHSLKTPLAVMRSQLNNTTDPQLRQQFEEQIERMDQVVRHQLQRAVLRHSDSSELCSVATAANRLSNALTKVYKDKAINFDLDIAESIQFRGDNADLMEILGNLLENACKYCDQTIRVSASNYQATGKAQIMLSIEDDGCGIEPDLRQQILARGQRADSINSGQGIGLSVAAEIVSDYGGEVRIESSSLGGAAIHVTLPSSSH